MKHPILPSQGGFSLLELLVAFSIMAFSLGMLYQASGSSARNVGDTEQHQHAAMLAESLVAMRDSVPESGWNEDGESAGFAWHVRSTAYPTAVKELNATPLHEIKVTVTWGGRDRGQLHQLDLSTLLPQRKPAPG